MEQTQELFDILDSSGRRTGTVKCRDEAHKKGMWHLAVVCFVVNKKNQILMQRRAKNKKVWPGLWDISIGGHGCAGETGIAAAIREAKEELGLTLKPNEIEFIGYYKSSIEPKDEIIDNHFNEFFVTFKEFDITTAKLQKEEVEEIKWVDLTELKQLINNNDASVVTKHNAFKLLFEYLESRKKTLVFGCFDLFHAGHLYLLNNAKAAAGAGGELVAAILSDEFVQNKKSGRPIINQAERREIIGALRCVDRTINVNQKIKSPELMQKYNYENKEAFFFEALAPVILTERPNLIVSSDTLKIGAAAARFLSDNKIEVQLIKPLDQISTTKIIEKINGKKFY